MGNRKRILIAEDRTLLRQVLSLLLSAEHDIEVIGEARNGAEALHLASQLVPQLLLMDISLPGTNDTGTIAEIKQRHPDIRVLVLSEHRSEEHVRQALKAGADGYVLKHATPAELILAIRSILEGKTYLSPDVAEKVVSGYLGGGSGMARHTALENLTLREREVLGLIAEGRINRHIAGHLCMSVKTVEKHRANLMKKLDLHNIASLTAFAIEKGVLGSPNARGNELANEAGPVQTDPAPSAISS